MTKVKGVGRRKTQVDYLRNRRIYWELKEETEDRKNVETIVDHTDVRKNITSYFPQVHGPANKLDLR